MPQSPPYVDPPTWLDPLVPIAGLPTWAQAAILAAVAASLMILILAALRWFWTKLSR